MNEPHGATPADRFHAAMRVFDQHNAADPNVESTKGISRPRELLQAERLTDWVLRLAPNASEPLRLAARCQHIRRWEIPRSSFPMDRAGYLKWRATLKQFHADAAGAILREVGYPEEMILKVQALNLKKNFPNDPDSQALEDALCLVFLEHQFADLAQKTDDAKMVNALRKSWQKMSPAARSIAVTLPFREHEQYLLKQALAGGSAKSSD